MSPDVPDGSGGSRRRRRRARRPSMSPQVLAQPSTDTPPADGSAGPVPAPPAEHPQPPPAEHRHRADHDDGTEHGHRADHRHGPHHGRGGARPHRRRGPDDHHWRELDGAGHTQLGQSAALRARDANQPDAADLAAAERDVVIVHRHWKPEDDADRPPATRRTGRGRERRGR